MVTRDIEDAFVDAGLTLEQARAIAESFERRIQQVVGEATEGLATKEELRALRQEFFAWRGEMVQAFERHEAVINARFAEHREQVTAAIADQRRDFDQLRVELAELRADFAELRADFAELRTQMTDIAGRIDELDSRLNGRMDSLEARMEAMEARLNGRMDAMEARLNGRMDVLEARMDALEARMDALEARMAALEGRIDELIDFTRRIMFAGLTLLGILIVGLLSILIAVAV